MTEYAEPISANLSLLHIDDRKPMPIVACPIMVRRLLIVMAGRSL